MDPQISKSHLLECLNAYVYDSEFVVLFLPLTMIF